MILCICLIVLIAVLDQVSKALIAQALAPSGSFALIENIFHFTYVENRGAAFGMLAEHRWVFMVFSVVGIAAMAIWLGLAKPQSRWERTAVSFIVGGGIANMIDRVRLGYVIDFIDCRFIDFYVFNVADSFVTVGCAMFMLYVILDEVRESRMKKAEAQTAESAKAAEEEAAPSSEEDSHG